MRVTIADIRKALTQMESLNVDSVQLDIDSDGVSLFHENSEGVVTVKSRVYRDDLDPLVPPDIEWTTHEVSVMDDDGITPLQFKDVSKKKSLP